MPPFVSLEAIQETIKTLGLDNQVNASVFLNELERQVIRLEKRMPSPGLPPDFNNMIPEGVVRREAFSPEEIAERDRLQMFTKNLEGIRLSEDASLPPYPPGPTFVKKVELTPDEIARNRKMIEETEKLLKGRYYSTF